jgi:hypothetical protein
MGTEAIWSRVRPDHVYAVIDDVQEVHATVDALFAAGHDSGDVTVLCGAEGVGDEHCT